MTELTLPTAKQEEWRYADFEALETLAPEEFGKWKDVELAPGETRRKCLVLDGSGPELHRVRITVGEGARAEVVRAVHWGTATGNFLGRIDVSRDAQKTDAAQDFKGLLLERGASANTKPELEIYADDVKCAHGAAIGQMDETARFYMAARGIPPEIARKLLVRAFIADAFAALEDEGERERLLDAALAVLGDTV